MSKISVVGAGRVGENVALGLMQKQIANEVVLFDIVEGKPQGIGLDISQTRFIAQSDTHVYGSGNYEDMQGSDIVVVTAGFPRKPGMDRMDLLKKNLGINKAVMENVKKYAPDSMILYVANPIDVMTYAARELTGFDHSRVFGMAGVLDTSRFKAFCAMETKLSIKDIQAMVLGGHGDSMVPLVSLANISGVPLTHFIPKDKLDAIVSRTRKGGGEIVKLLGYSAYYAPAFGVAEMAKSILANERRVLPVVAYFDNKYGFNDIYAGAPVILGKNGVEEVIELDLPADEKEAYKQSLAKVQEGIKELKTVL